MGRSRLAAVAVVAIAALIVGLFLASYLVQPEDQYVQLGRKPVQPVDSADADPVLIGGGKDAVDEIAPPSTLPASASLALEVEVVAKDGGAPVPGAWVAALTTVPLPGQVIDPASAAAPLQRTGENGSVTLAPTTSVACVVAWSSEHGHVVMVVPAQASRVEVPLSRLRGSIVGRVLDTSGKPIEGATVASGPLVFSRAVHSSSDGRGPMPLQALGYSSSIRTDAAGRFRISVKADSRVRVAAFADGYAAPKRGFSTQGTLSVASKVARDGAELKLVLSRTHLFFVRLVDNTSREPLSNAPPQDVTVLEAGVVQETGNERILFNGRWVATYGCRDSSCTAEDLDASRVVGVIRLTAPTGPAPKTVRLVISVSGYRPVTTRVPVWTSGTEPKWHEVPMAWAEERPARLVRVHVKRAYPDSVWGPKRVILTLPRSPDLPFECAGRRVGETDVFEFPSVPDVDAEAVIQDGVADARFKLRAGQSTGYTAEFRSPTGVIVQASHNGVPVHGMAVQAVQVKEGSGAGTSIAPMRVAFAPWTLRRHPKGLDMVQQLWAGTYDLYVLKPGYEAFKERVRVERGKIVRVGAKLKRAGG